MSDIVQIRFDYGVLTPEQAQRTQDKELRIIGRTQRAIVENGKDLSAVKEDIGHGHFLNWIRSLGISESTAQNWMGAAENFGQMPNGWVFENRAIYLLSTSKVPESARDEAKQRASDGEKITEELARQIRDAHKAKEEAEQRAQAAQQQLFQLQQEMETLSKPERVEVQVIPPETQAALTRLEQENAKKDTLLKQKSERVKTLTEEVKKYTLLDKQEKHNEQIRAKWRGACDAFHQGINQGCARLVTPIDARQAFESDDWARLAEVEATLQQALEKLATLRESITSQFVDASLDYVGV